MIWIVVAFVVGALFGALGVGIPLARRIQGWQTFTGDVTENLRCINRGAKIWKARYEQDRHGADN